MRAYGYNQAYSLPAIVATRCEYRPVSVKLLIQFSMRCYLALNRIAMIREPILFKCPRKLILTFCAISTMTKRCTIDC